MPARPGGDPAPPRGKEKIACEMGNLFTAVSRAVLEGGLGEEGKRRRSAP